MKRYAVATLLLVFAMSQANGQETYDLLKLKKREPSPGERFREIAREDNSQTQIVMNQGQVQKEAKKKARFESSRVVECFEVDDAGEPTKLVYTYGSFQLAPSEKEFDVKGLKVQFTRGADKKYAYERVEGPQIPEELKDKLQSELVSMNRDSKEDVLFPKKPVAVGATWDIAADDIVKGTGLPAKGMDKSKTSGSGALTSVETNSDGIELLNVELTFELTYSSFEGMECSEPMVWKLVLKAQFSADGSVPTGVFDSRMEMTGAVSPPGAPPGMSLRLETKGQKFKSRKALK